MPGAFEGETVTRRRFMNVTAQAAGGIAVAAFALPGARLRGRLGALRPPAGRVGGRSARARRLPDGHVHPARDHRGRAASARSARPRSTCASATRRSTRRRTRQMPERAASSSRSPRAACTSAARCATSTPPQRFVCPCHGGVYDFQGQVDGGPPVRPLDRFYTRVRNGQVEVGPRYSVNSEFQPLPVLPRSRRSTSTASASTSIPGRFSDAQAEQLGMPHHKLPLPRFPAALQPKPKRPGEDEQVKPLDQAKEAGIARGRLGRRAHLAVGRRPLGDVPQGPEGHELVLHAGLRDDVRLPLAGGHRRRSWRCTTTRRRRSAYESARSTSTTTSSSASSCAACTTGARR